MVRQLRSYHLRDGRILTSIGVKHRAGVEEGSDYGRETVVLHRVDGPAVTYASGYEGYYVHGLRHRIDGPAIAYSDGDELYYLFGEEVTKEEHDARVKKLNKTELALLLLSELKPVRLIAQVTMRQLDESSIHKASGETTHTGASREADEDD